MSIAVVLLLVAGHAAIFAEGLDECDSYGYMYTLQPPTAVVCNPYLRNVLNLTCAVAGELVDDIQWYFRPVDSDEPVILTNNSQVTIVSSAYDGDYGVIMTIHNLTSENEGFYWCQGLVQHDDRTLELSQSLEFQLLEKGRYIQLPCQQRAQKSSEVRCAAVIPAIIPAATTTLAHAEHTSTVEILHTFDESSTVLPNFSPVPTIGVSSSARIRIAPSSKPTSDAPPSIIAPGSAIQLSDIILYAILGLLGCLILLVFCLSIVISILCCKKRRNSLEGKDTRYDQFSTESEAPHGTMTLKSLDSYPLGPPLPPPYRLPIQTSNSGTMTPSSSGIYDEIHTVASQYGSQPGPANHHYQEIPVDSNDTNAPPDSDACPRDSALGGEIESDTAQTLSSENPYNLPDQTDSSTVDPHFLQLSDASEGTSSPLQQESSIFIEQTDAQSSVADSSEFTNSNLQVTPPPEDIKSCSTSSGRSAATHQLEPKQAAPHVDIVIEPMIEESIAVATLPVIPEHPYHVLEEQQVRDKLQSTSPSCESSGDPVPPPKILSVSLSEDEGYDRLVGPPHIYHILHKPPSLTRPQVRECSPTSGYHHLSNRMENGDQFHATLPLPDDLLYSEENSTISGGELFDDPMYNCSPKRAIRSGPPKSLHNSHNGQVSTLETTRREKPINLSKYRGDYERDPTYMKFIREASKQRNESGEESDHTNVGPLMKERTLSSTKSTSLPDITTGPMYQSLQTLTRDPLRNYEMLHKRQLTVNTANA